LSIQLHELENELGAKLIVPQLWATVVTEIGPASTPRGQTWIEEQQLA
jgi:hypothetical protein